MNRDEMTKDLSRRVLNLLLCGSTLNPDDVIFLDNKGLNKDFTELEITYE